MTTVTIIHDTTHVPGAIAQDAAVHAGGRHLDEHAVAQPSESLRRRLRARETDFLDRHGGRAERALDAAARILDRAA